jgi:hypothetical protein
VVQEKSIITPGYIHDPGPDTNVDTAEERLTDSAPVQVNVLSLDTSSTPASGTSNTQNGS